MFWTCRDPEKYAHARMKPSIFAHDVSGSPHHLRTLGLVADRNSDVWVVFNTPKTMVNVKKENLGVII